MEKSEESEEAEREGKSRLGRHNTQRHMTILLTILVIIEAAAFIGVLKMIVALNKKFDALQTAFNTPLKILDDQVKVIYERVDKIDDRLPVMAGWCETLRANQDTLQGDLEKVFYGTKKDIRKVEQKQDRATAEAQKPV